MPGPRHRLQRKPLTSHSFRILRVLSRVTNAPIAGSGLADSTLRPATRKTQRCREGLSWRAAPLLHESGVADPRLSGLSHRSGWTSPFTRRPVLFRRLEACSLTPPPLPTSALDAGPAHSDAIPCLDGVLGNDRGAGATESPVNKGESPHSQGDWEREDSNLRRLSRQIYSLLPLTTRAHSQPSEDRIRDVTGPVKCWGGFCGRPVAAVSSCPISQSATGQGALSPPRTTCRAGQGQEPAPGAGDSRFPPARGLLEGPRDWPVSQTVRSGVHVALEVTGSADRPSLSCLSGRRAPPQLGPLRSAWRTGRRVQPPGLRRFFFLSRGRLGSQVRRLLVRR